MTSRPSMPRRRALTFAMAGLAAAPRAFAQADAYPSRQMRFIVSFPAGSATDQVARLIAAQMTKATGQTIVIDNRGGASGMIACEAVAKAPPDGYTVLITTGTTHAANPSLFKKLPYDPVKDFVPITPVSNNAFVLVVAPSSPANSVADLARLARAQPGKLSFASGNAPSRIGGEMFKMMANVDLLHVPYKGAPQALTDLMGGQVSMMWTDLRTGMPQVAAGKLRALAVTGAKRLALYPNIPTMIEQGFPDYVLSNWVGVYLPASTPQAIANRLNALVHAAVRADQASHENTGGEVMLLSPADFAALQARDTAMWARVTKAAGMEPE
ncbi:MAG: tripartite tricarboxylate transporter substrate binding protein [Burkholderiales bacterium]|nr:tripartite tricarboxylate transporter substrate binding protein [Burkholderiales bacterium]